MCFFFFFFKQKTAYEIGVRLVGSEMCIRDRLISRLDWNLMRKYDVVVIGAGPGGMTAALYAARANLNVAMLDRGIYGGQMNNTDDIENYPGFTTIKGPELGEKMYQGTVKAGVNFVYGDVQNVTVDDQQMKHIQTDSDELVASAVITVSYTHLTLPTKRIV